MLTYLGHSDPFLIKQVSIEGFNHYIIYQTRPMSSILMQSIQANKPDNNPQAETGDKAKATKQVRQSKRKAEQLFDDSVTKNMAIAEQVVKKSAIFIDEIEDASFADFRRKYTCEILKLLLYGYLELVHENEVRRALDLEPLSHLTVKWLEKIGHIQQATVELTKKSLQLEEAMFGCHNTVGCGKGETKKYRFQMMHLLRNLGDPFNSAFREEIITGALGVDLVACLSELDMLEPRKREYVVTKNRSLLGYQDLKQKYAEREEKYRKWRKVEMVKQIALQEESLQYFLSTGFVSKLEYDLMEIPFKASRKATLRNIKRVFST